MKKMSDSQLELLEYIKGGGQVQFMPGAATKDYFWHIDRRCRVTVTARNLLDRDLVTVKFIAERKRHELVLRVDQVMYKACRPIGGHAVHAVQASHAGKLISRTAFCGQTAIQRGSGHTTWYKADTVSCTHCKRIIEAKGAKKHDELDQTSRSAGPGDPGESGAGEPPGRDAANAGPESSRDE